MFKSIFGLTFNVRDINARFKLNSGQICRKSTNLVGHHVVTRLSPTEYNIYVLNIFIFLKIYFLLLQSFDQWSFQHANKI